MKTVLITGITRGLGKELFELFVSRGYSVYGVLRSETKSKKLTDTLPKNAKLILADVSSDTCIKTIKQSVGNIPIDLLINNAGIGGESHLIDNIEPVEISNLINTHCIGVFRTVKALKANLLLADKPIVINLNSRLGSITRQSNGVYKNITVSYSYRIAKAAQNMLTNCLRSEFNQAIQFISLHPGKMKTDIAQVDANLEPVEVANSILYSYERGLLKEENGILELDKGVIEW
jgi:short-subunit dehydrogenase